MDLMKQSKIRSNVKLYIHIEIGHLYLIDLQDVIKFLVNFSFIIILMIETS